MRFLIINGPNLNLLGVREPEHYGLATYDDMVSSVTETCQKFGIEAEFFQSNHEGAIVDRIHKAYFDGVDAIIMNAGAYTHTSIAILDALKATRIPCAEVHISKVEEREDFRQVSYCGMACCIHISGRGIAGYSDAVREMKGRLDDWMTR